MTEEEVLGLIKHHVHPAIGTIRRADRDGLDTSPAFEALERAFEAATRAVLAEQVGNDGLTDAERDELAKRYAEGPARSRTPEEIAAIRSRVAGQVWEVSDEVGLLVAKTPAKAPPTAEQIDAAAKAAHARLMWTRQVGGYGILWPHLIEDEQEGWRDYVREILKAAGASG